MIHDGLLTIAGWRPVEDGPTNTPYERFVSRLDFSLQGGWLIDPPAGSAGFDFTETGPGTEFELRRALYELFREAFSSDICYLIDVNHGEWSFLPRDLKLTSHFEPFPASITPWAEYVVVATGDYAHGVFCNPTNRHLVAFGTPFIERFSASHGDRLVAARVAAEHRRVAD